MNRQILESGKLRLDCSGQATHVMGILNVTPDSFSDGGQFLDPTLAARRAKEMVAEGAVIVDIGGASSRPRGAIYGEGARPLTPAEEMGRVLPVVEAVAGECPDTWISIDTFSPDVAVRALENGAHIINDITGLRLHPELADVAAGHGAPMILMHSVGMPGEMPHRLETGDVVAEVSDSLRRSVALALERGASQLVLDPGFGFGKSIEGNLKMLNRVDRLLEAGYPVLVGISRKSTIGAVLSSGEDPAPVDRRLFGTLGATAVAVMRGARIVRTHDVRETVEMLRLVAATLCA